MIKYRIKYKDKTLETLYFECMAEDLDHAIEQLNDHELTLNGVYKINFVSYAFGSVL